MLELNINGKKIMELEDNNKTIIFDKNIAKDVGIDIEGRVIDFELKDTTTSNK